MIIKSKEENLPELLNNISHNSWIWDTWEIVTLILGNCIQAIARLCIKQNKEECLEPDH